MTRFVGICKLNLNSENKYVIAFRRCFYDHGLHSIQVFAIWNSALYMELKFSLASVFVLSPPPQYI
jgi:hypothetical protein